MVEGTKSANSFLHLAELILKKTERPMSAKEIWKYSETYGYIYSSKSKKPEDTLNQQLYIDIKENRNTKFFKIDKFKPKKFFIRDLKDDRDLERIIEEQIIKEDEQADNLGFEGEQLDGDYSFDESELHPFLASYMSYYKQIHTKTINHRKTGTRKYMEWQHPDMVGVNYIDFESEVLALGKILNTQPLTLYSYELKKKLTSKDYREAYFQAVSNSSWANEGYLVAAEVEEDQEFWNELKRLNLAFGIGIIKIDIDYPANTEILFPAKSRDLDWITINKLAKENQDFSQFVKRIGNGEFVPFLYDEVVPLDVLPERIKKK